MKRLALALVAGLLLIAAPSIAVAVGTWSSPSVVPGITGLNPVGAQVRSISCADTGLCIAGGDYADANGDGRVFLSERTGSTWGNAFELPGVTAAPGLGYASVRDISCSSDGGCSMVGDYGGGATAMSFVATRGGGGAIDVPGLAAVNVGNNVQATGISCASAGNCSIIGTYVDSLSREQVYVSNQEAGSWSNVQTLTGFSDIAIPSGISCGAADDCVAVGFMVGTPFSGFIVERTGSSWGTPIWLPIYTGNVAARTVSCVTAAFCVVGVDADDPDTAGYTMTRINGNWSFPQAVPNLANLANLAGTNVTQVWEVSCWAVGTCSMTGTIGTGNQIRTWVADMEGGTWGDAQLVPGSAALGDGSGAMPKHISCSSSGLCAIAGQYAPGPTSRLSWVSTRSGGTWSTAHALAPIGPIGSFSYDDPDGVACNLTECSVGGGYFDGTGNNPLVAWLADYVDEQDPTTTTTAQSDPVTPTFTG